MDDDEGKKGAQIHSYPVLGGFGDLEKIVDKYEIEEIIIAIQDFPEEKIIALKDFTDKNNIELKRMGITVNTL